MIRSLKKYINEQHKVSILTTDKVALNVNKKDVEYYANVQWIDLFGDECDYLFADRNFMASSLLDKGLECTYFEFESKRVQDNSKLPDEHLILKLCNNEGFEYESDDCGIWIKNLRNNAKIYFPIDTNIASKRAVAKPEMIRYIKVDEDKNMCFKNGADTDLKFSYRLVKHK